MDLHPTQGQFVSLWINSQLANCLFACPIWFFMVLHYMVLHCIGSTWFYTVVIYAMYVCFMKWKSGWCRSSYFRSFCEITIWPVWCHTVCLVFNLVAVGHLQPWPDLTWIDPIYQLSHWPPECFLTSHAVAVEGINSDKSERWVLWGLLSHHRSISLSATPSFSSSHPPLHPSLHSFRCLSWQPLLRWCSGEVITVT